MYKNAQTYFFVAIYTQRILIWSKGNPSKFTSGGEEIFAINFRTFLFD